MMTTQGAATYEAHFLGAYSIYPMRCYAHDICAIYGPELGLIEET